MIFKHTGILNYFHSYYKLSSIYFIYFLAILWNEFEIFQALFRMMMLFTPRSYKQYTNALQKPVLTALAMVNIGSKLVSRVSEQLYAMFRFD